ncbi:MAG: hypothetical protein H8D97_00165 [Proteobacteria bacterium]|nr:hypothetical protein [Pseudomonadota bacterium]
MFEYSLDRIDNNQGYIPGNLRWATHIEQNRNQEQNVITTTQVKEIREKSKQGISGIELAEIYNCYPSTISMILNKQQWA